MYITISYLFRKKNGQNIADETVAFVRRLRNNDLKRANVILDMKNKDLVKCRDFNLYGKVVNTNDENVTYQRLLDYVHAAHPQEVDAILTVMEATKVLV